MSGEDPSEAWAEWKASDDYTGTPLSPSWTAPKGHSGFNVGLDALKRGENPSKAWAEWNEEQKKKIPSFQQGGVVDGDYLGQPKVIKAHAGEMVIPNYVGCSQLQQSGALGDVWRPPASIWGSEVSRPAVRQIPSTIEGDFRFRSPQTIRRMTPSQRMMFQEGVKSFGYPWEDWRMQERLATGAGGAGRPMARFRRLSFVRG